MALRTLRFLIDKHYLILRDLRDSRIEFGTSVLAFLFFPILRKKSLMFFQFYF